MPAETQPDTLKKIAWGSYAHVRACWCVLAAPAAEGDFGFDTIAVPFSVAIVPNTKINTIVFGLFIGKVHKRKKREACCLTLFQLYPLSYRNKSNVNQIEKLW